MDRTLSRFAQPALPSLSSKSGMALIGAVFVIGAFLAPPTPFIIDGGVYYDMARAISDEGSLAIARNGGVEGAPPLTKYLTHGFNGAVYPQYPSGYALLAAPFYKAFGMRGLMLMNALGALASLWLTFNIALRLFGRRTALWSVGILAAATFMPTYVFGVWPHMTALAFWLGAIWMALLGVKETNTNKANRLFLISGLLIGAGLNIRIDVFLVAPVLFLWLRLFAKPSDKIAPFFVLLGMTPGLFLSAYLNHIKFGVFAPFSYGYDSGAGSINRYLPVIVAGGAFVIASWAVNLPAAAMNAAKHFGVKYCLAALSVIAVVFALTFGDFLWNALFGVYVLVINLQEHDAYHQVGVERNEFGQLLFWGYPKKALIQSLPFLPLLLAPIYWFFRGKRLVEFSLCLLAIAAPISFYALNQWHGGGSYNMRYFIPALPFIAILSAWTLSKLVGACGGMGRQQFLLIGFFTVALYLVSQEIGRMSEAFFVPAALYPQWALAALVAFGVAAYLAQPKNPFNAQVALFGSTLSLFYAAAVNLSEEFGHEKTRAEQLAMANDISAPIPGGALVISQSPLMFIPAERAGALLMVTEEENMQQAITAINAFAAAGHCVYFHNSLSRNLVAPYLARPIEQQPIWAQSVRFAGDPRLAFFTLSSQSATCAFQ